MNTMKRATLILAGFLLLFFLTGCRTPEEAPETINTAISGQTYDTGQFRVLVPEPWRVIPVTDFTGQITTDGVFLRKGGDSDWKVTEKSYIRLTCYRVGEAPTDIPDESLYRQVQALRPMELGDLLWTGYTADNYHGKAKIGRLGVLRAEDGSYTYQALVWFKSGGESISLDDVDLQAILASVTPSIE